MEYSHELIIPNDDIPFKMFIFEGRDGHYVREGHWHRSVEIMALFEGELEFVVDGVSCRLVSGEFMLINSNEVHSIRAPGENLTIVLQIPLDTFKDYYTDENFIYFSHDSHAQDAEVMRLIDRMYETYSTKKCGYDLKVRSQFYELLYLLVTRYRQADVDEDTVRRNQKLNRLTEVTSYMKEHYNESFTLEEIANRFGYSSAYLSRMFRKYAKVNYKTYLDSLRLEHACKDLISTNLTISELSSRNGFPNSKAFTKAFFRKYGQLPSEARKCQKNAIN